MTQNTKLQESNSKKLQLPLQQTAKIERAKREWEVTVDTLPQLICLLDHQHCILRANRTIERWYIDRVDQINGHEAHRILHKGCTDPTCYLNKALNHQWRTLTQGINIETEAYDEILRRYIHLRLEPLLSSDAQKANQAGTSDSFAVLVLEDISQQKQAEITLQQYAQELEIRNKELDIFARTVAHNLRGPLQPIVGNAKLLKMTWDSTPKEVVLEDLDSIARNGQKMNRIISELLLLAGIDKTEVTMTSLDMAAVMQSVQQRLSYLLDDQQVEMIVPETWPVASGYAPWVEEIWTNYISNGIKYGGQPPKLTFGASVLPENENLVQFWVQDNGSGLSSEEQSKLFLPFTQLNQIKVDGYGLGLSIVRYVAEKLGGSVGVESTGIAGQGCKFSFTLPVTQSPSGSA